MFWARATLADLDRRGGGRVAWADVAKAISIVLLVLWTTVGDAVLVNELLTFARMPLFFFVSGLFAYRAVVEADLGAFLRDRVANLVYLYALWTWLLFLSTRLVARLAEGEPFAPWRQLEIFWDPPLTIWFLYALAIAFLVARLARGLPVALVAAAALTAYAYCVWTGDWRDTGFLERLVRLFPFFWLGLAARPLAVRLVEARPGLWPLAGAAFLALAWAIWDTPLDRAALLTVAASLLGVAWLLMLSCSLARRGWSRPLAIVGASTLYIYVLQRILLFYIERGFGALDLAFPGEGVVAAALIVVLATLLGRWAARTPGLGWLFQAPWVGAPEPRVVPSRV
jgi:fucose 4-O-acetylase-like acetyltransferase